MQTSLWYDFKRHVLQSGNFLNKLLAINIIIFVFFGLIYVIDALFTFHIGIDDKLRYWLSFPASPVRFLYRPWSIFTYQFVHSGFWHILNNVIVLYVGGRIFREFLGDRKLLNVYLIGGAAGAVLYMLAYQFLPLFADVKGIATVIGASASALAVLVAAGTLVPDYTISLILIGPVKLKYIVLVLFVIDMLSVAGGNAGGHIAHIGGAIFGFVYIKQLNNGHDLGNWLTRFAAWLSSFFTRQPAMRVHRGGGYTGESRSQRQDRVSQEQVDAILDKIARSGYSSLSDREKDILSKASKDN